MNPRDYAVLLAAKGLPVFKLSYSNRPLQERFWEAASQDPAEIARTWGEDSQHNIGIATGDGLIVVDIDVKKGAAGHESLEVLEALGLPRETLTVQTTSVNEAGEPGLHFFYRVPAGVWPNKVGWFPGVDVRGHHGYVVGAGSEKNGRLYNIVQDLPIAQMPAGLLAQLASGPRTAAPLIVPEWADNEQALAAARAYLRQEAPELGEGERDAGLIKIANRVLDFGVSPGMATILIANHWLETKCFPPVPFEDVEEKVRNAAKSRQEPIGCRPPRPDATDCFEPLRDGENFAGAQPGFGFRVIRVTELGTTPPKPREWIVPGLIPAGAVTLLSGDGGVGKSLLALQLCAAMALDENWLNRAVAPGRTLYFSAEDDRDELHRRLDAIRRHYGASFADMGAMQLLDFTGCDAIIGSRNPAGNIVGTKIHRALCSHAAAFRPSLIVIDTLADTFGGDEIVRTQARQFVALLRAIAPESATVLLLAHPSLSGMASKAGTSGSTGWRNSVRSQLYFTTGKDGVRTLEHKKANYGPIDSEIKLAWQGGVFVPVIAAAVEEDSLTTFMELGVRLQSYGKSLAPVSGRWGAPYAIVELMGLVDDEAKTAYQRMLQAMNHLLGTGRIKTEEYQKKDGSKAVRLVF